MRKLVSLIVVAAVLALAGAAFANSKEDVYRTAVAAVSGDPRFRSHTKAINVFKGELDLYQATPGADSAFVETMQKVLTCLREEAQEHFLGSMSKPKEMTAHFDKSLEAGRQAKTYLEIAKKRLGQR